MTRAYVTAFVIGIFLASCDSGSAGLPTTDATAISGPTIDPIVLQDPKTLKTVETASTAPEGLVEGSLVDDSYIWLSGPEIKRTKDGGKTWWAIHPSDVDQSVLISYGNNFNRVRFIDKQRGWITIGSQGTWQTEDGGRNFAKIFEFGSDLPVFSGRFGWVQVSLNSVSNKKPLHGFLKSFDRGKSWNRCSTENSENFSMTGPVFFLDEADGWAVVSSHENTERPYVGVARSSDGGCSWRLIWKNHIDLDESYKEVFFLSKNEGWICGFQTGSLLHTTDGGISWRPLDLPEIRTRVWSVFFESSQDGWLLAKPFDSGDAAGIFRTTNGGRTWAKTTPPIHLPDAWESGRLHVAIEQNRR